MLIDDCRAGTRVRWSQRAEDGEITRHRGKVDLPLIHDYVAVLDDQRAEPGVVTFALADGLRLEN